MPYVRPKAAPGTRESVAFSPFRRRHKNRRFDIPARKRLGFGSANRRRGDALQAANIAARFLARCQVDTPPKWSRSHGK